MKNCQNCGHHCHCGTSCQQDVIDEFGNKYQIECCKHCRHETVEDSWEDTVKYDAGDYESFNGA